MTVVPQSRLNLLTEMEERYEKNDTQYFVDLLDHDDYVFVAVLLASLLTLEVRTRYSILPRF